MLVVLFILLLMCAIIASLGYYTYTVTTPSGVGPTTTPTPVYRFEMVDDKPVLTQIEPSDCKGDVYVKKKSCHNRQTGDLLDGTANKCGDGVEEWILDPDASGYQRAIGNGTCESDFRPCNVVCDTPCEGATWIEGACIRDGVVLDGSETDKCGRGMRTYTLDENASDYVASTGRGTCTKTYSSACDVECPQNAVAPPSCVYSSTPQKSANGCVVSKEDRADQVGYDEDGWQEWFKLALEAENCTGEKRLSEWETCRGPPTPVNCVGTWGPDGGWGPCTGSCGAQPTQSRTYTHKPAAANGGEACAIADGAVETRNCGTVQPCCEVGEWQDGTCASDGLMTQTRDVKENIPGACTNVETTNDKRCCYQGGDWTAQGGCGLYQSGKQKYTQTVAGNCPTGTDTKYEDCAPCQYHTIESTNKFCQTYETGNYGMPNWSTYDAAAKAYKNVIDVAAVGTGGCPGTSIAVVKVGNDCSGTVGRVNELGGWNFGEEPDSTSDSQRESVVMANGGWKSKLVRAVATTAGGRQAATYSRR